jgi:type I restriction enzyme S subunit
MKYKLSEVMDLIGGGTPKTTKPEYWDGDIPWLSVKDFNNDFRFVYETEKHITELGLNNSSTKLLKAGDVIISARGTVGEIATIPFPMAFNQSCYGLRAKKEIVTADFLYYLIKHNIHVLKKNTHGSVFDTITRDTFAGIEVDIPDMDSQTKIAEILSNIDEKIEVNVRINENLEQQAQAIYCDMFITNANPSWQLGRLSDLIAVRYGKNHKKLADGIYPVYGSGGIMRYAEKPLYDKESVLIPRKGTLNNVMYVNKPFWSVDTMFFTEMKLPNVAKFVFHFVKSKDLASLNAGSAVPSMTTDILNAMELSIPDANTLYKFENIVAPMYQAMQQNTQQSSKLAELRDSLLPRLMSGEIDVTDIQI